MPSDILNLQLKALRNVSIQSNCVCSEKFPKVSLNDVIILCSLSVAAHVSDITEYNRTTEDWRLGSSEGDVSSRVVNTSAPSQVYCESYLYLAGSRGGPTLKVTLVRLLFKVSRLLTYDDMSIDTYLSTFRRSLLSPSSASKQSRKNESYLFCFDP